MGEMTPHSGSDSAPQANGEAGPVVSACMSVRADVSVEEILTYFRTHGGLPNGLVLFVLDHNHDFVGTVALARLASAQPSMFVRDLTNARRLRVEGRLFEGAAPSGTQPATQGSGPSMGSIARLHARRFDSGASGFRAGHTG